MNDNLDDMLGGLEEPTYKEQEKKGAPSLDAADLEGLLGETPAVWEESSARRGAPTVEEPVELDSPAQQTWTEEKHGAPQVEAPELDAGSYTQAASGHEELQMDTNAEDLLGSAAQSYDPVAEFCEKLKLDDALKKTFIGLPAEKQQQITEMRAGQLGIAVPKIPKELRAPEPVSPQEALPAEEEIVLEEAPKPEAYVPKFKDEDLERAKEEAKKPKAYTPPQKEMTEEQKMESRRLMGQLREEREHELAHKGFMQLILLTVLGIIAAVAFSLFFSGAFGLGYKMEDELGWMAYVKNYAPYYGAAMGLSALLLAAPIPQLKGLTKFLHGLGFVLMLFPGIPLLIQKEEGHAALNGLFFGAALVLSGVVVFVLTTSDGIHMYNKHGNS
jgi:hypothetical protein